MTSDRDFQAVMRSWLQDSAAQPDPPGLLQSVLEETARYRPRHPWLVREGIPQAPSERSRMDRWLPIGLGVAAALAALALLVGIIATAGPRVGHPTQTPVPTGVSAGAWTNAEPMQTARYLETATLLPDGRLLVAGGRLSATRPDNALNSAEIYDPADGHWQSTTSMVGRRSSHTATLLPDGRVLVAGGFDDWAALASAEIYDPATGRWTATGNMLQARGYHTATLLPDGRVLVTGGRSNNSSTGHLLDTAELYDPQTRQWTATSPMHRARAFHTATLLRNGLVLVAGAGLNGARVDLGQTAELYDPTTGLWRATGSMTIARAYHTATMLPNGKVLVAGGFQSFAGSLGVGDGTAVATAELYDPASGSWRAVASMTIARGLHTATLARDGHVLVVGGSSSGGFGAGTSTYSTAVGIGDSELYDPASNRWTAAGPTTGRESHAAVLLLDGRLLIVGGAADGEALRSAQLYSESKAP